MQQATRLQVCEELGGLDLLSSCCLVYLPLLGVVIYRKRKRIRTSATGGANIAFLKDLQQHLYIPGAGEGAGAKLGTVVVLAQGSWWFSLNGTLPFLTAEEENLNKQTNKQAPAPVPTVHCVGEDENVLFKLSNDETQHELNDGSLFCQLYILRLQGLS